MTTSKPAQVRNGNSPPAPPAASAKVRVPAAWAWHHRALLALRRRLGAETRQHQLDSAATSVGQDFTEPVDTVSDQLEHDLLLAELKFEEHTLADVEAALARIAAGTYGTCEVSGQRIPADRLRALPWTRVTREVAEQQERNV
jgi:RNA polymerase-binding transcription factor DksA